MNLGDSVIERNHLQCVDTAFTKSAQQPLQFLLILLYCFLWGRSSAEFSQLSSKLLDLFLIFIERPVHQRSLGQHTLDLDMGSTCLDTIDFR